MSTNKIYIIEDKGLGLQKLINECNTIVITEKTRQEALKRFKEEYNIPKEERVIYLSEQQFKLLEEFYLQWNNHEKQIKTFWENKLKNE